MINMILIGFLYHRKDPRTLKKAYYYAQAAKEEGAEFLYFSPNCVDFQSRTINGYVYDEIVDDWVKVNRRFPDVIYNIGSPQKLSRSQTIVDRLRAEIPFTSHSVGNKITVYRRLEKTGVFKKYVIPTQIVSSPQDIFDFLNRYSKLVFKPTNGHRGDGVTFIERSANQYLVQTEDENHLYTQKQFAQFIYQRLQRSHYLVQPYINSRTKDGHAYDLRLHVQKNGEARWVIATMYAKISPSESIVTNGHRGGICIPINQFLKHEFSDSYDEMKKTLDDFALHLARHLDDIQIKNHSHPLDELGIDVGIDQNNKIWLYEVNWLPGMPRDYYGKIGVERNQIRYAIFLANQKN